MWWRCWTPLAQSISRGIYQFLCTVTNLLTYQLHPLGLVVVDVLDDVSICHPLGDHSKSCIRRAVPTTDPDESQDVGMIQ